MPAPPTAGHSNCGTASRVRQVYGHPCKTKKIRPRSERSGPELAKKTYCGARLGAVGVPPPLLKLLPNDLSDPPLPTTNPLGLPKTATFEIRTVELAPPPP